MRLLNTSTLQLEEFPAAPRPPYAILSHTWDNEEVLYGDIQRRNQKKVKNFRWLELHISGGDDEPEKAGWAKVRGCARAARERGLEYCWIDTCCIDKSSSTELSEAINSMYQWYREADVCIAYLSDLRLYLAADRDVEWYVGRYPDVVDRMTFTLLTIDNQDLQSLESFANSTTRLDIPKWTKNLGLADYSLFAGAALCRTKWLGRGWTLQELVAPKTLYFYAADWDPIGAREDFAASLERYTGIPPSVYGQPDALAALPVETRMAWTKHRQTTRPEDLAYCLMGIFDISMGIIYGEGKTKAFRRLNEEIDKEERRKLEAAKHERQGDHRAGKSLLPSGWEIRHTSGGTPYYVDHNTQRTSWTLPD